MQPARRGPRPARRRARRARRGPRPGRRSSTSRCAWATSMARRPASVISPAASMSAARCRFSRVHGSSACAVSCSCSARSLVEHVHRGVDPTEADRLLDRLRVRADRLVRSEPATSTARRPAPRRGWPPARRATGRGSRRGRSGSRTSTSPGVARTSGGRRPLHHTVGDSCSPAAAVDDVVEAPAVGFLDRLQRAVGGIAQGEHVGGVTVTRQAEDAPNGVLITDR